jgi:mannose-1-phosphate guanylyltransferase
MSFYTVILCGGGGTRLWPLSTKNHPKQFLSFDEGRSLFQKTLLRNDFNNPLVIIVGKDHYQEATRQFAAISSHLSEVARASVKFLVEPVGKNTAPAIALAAEVYPQQSFLVVPSDHIIPNHKAYQNLVLEGTHLSQTNSLITFGIKPTDPNCGYGYIEYHDKTVKRFHEKPNLAQAQAYLKQGNFLWNSGIFFFERKTYQREMQLHNPQILKLAQQIISKTKNLDSYFIALDEMMTFDAVSIDVALFEKSHAIKVMPANLAWSDVGIFDSLIDFIPPGHSLEIDSANNFVINHDHAKKVALIGVKDMIVVNSENGLLICQKGQSQKVKDLF